MIDRNVNCFASSWTQSNRLPLSYKAFVHQCRLYQPCWNVEVVCRFIQLFFSEVFTNKIFQRIGRTEKLLGVSSLKLLPGCFNGGNRQELVGIRRIKPITHQTQKSKSVIGGIWGIEADIKSIRYSIAKPNRYGACLPYDCWWKYRLRVKRGLSTACCSQDHPAAPNTFLLRGQRQPLFPMATENNLCRQSLFSMLRYWARTFARYGPERSSKVHQ